MYALNEETGAVLWTRALQIAIGPPALADGVIYAETENSTSLLALDESTGVILWGMPLDYRTSTWGGPIVSNGVIYVPTDNLYGPTVGTVTAIDAATQQVLWKFADGVHTFIGALAITDGVVYAPSYSPSDAPVFALDARTGAKLWSSQVPTEEVNAVTVANGVAYAGSYDGSLVALDAATGEEIWSFASAGGSMTTPSIVDGMVFAASFDEHVYAFALAGEGTGP